jgi:hypothetical protein
MCPAEGNISFTKYPTGGPQGAVQMLKSKWFDNDKVLLSLLILLSAAVRIFFLLKFDAMPGDATGHVTMALPILEDPRLLSNFDGNSSTLYKYGIASFLWFWRDPILAPRVFTMLFGIFSVVPYYGTLKILFDRTIAFFATLTLVFYPLHVIQSSVTTSEAVYYFFLFSAFYYLFSYKIIQKRLSALLLSSLSLNIASLLRFECWIFIPVFFILLWPKGKGRAFLFLILSLVFPCALLELNQIAYRNFLYSFTTPSKTLQSSVAMGRFLYDSRWWNWLDVLWRSSGPSVVIGGLSGIVLAFLMRQKRQLSIFFLILWLAFTVNTMSARMVSGVRYSIILGLFLIPYAWFFIERLLALLRLRKIVFFALSMIILAAGFAQLVWKENSPTNEIMAITPPEVINVGTWLRDHVRADETLIISNDRCDGFQSNIMLRSETSPQMCLLLYARVHANQNFASKEAFEQYIWEHRTNYLVLNSESYLQEILKLDLNKKRLDLGAALFEVVFEQNSPMFGRYIIYRISYRGSSGNGGNA